MKQIKTIIRRSDNQVKFDEEVNKALAEGWTLVKRDVLQPFEGPTRIFYRLLYAELEREAEPRVCLNCRHYYEEACGSPCARCDKGPLDKWEQGAGIVAVEKR